MNAAQYKDFRDKKEAARRAEEEAQKQATLMQDKVKAQEAIKKAEAAKKAADEAAEAAKKAKQITCNLDKDCYNCQLDTQVQGRVSKYYNDGACVNSVCQRRYMTTRGETNVSMCDRTATNAFKESAVQAAPISRSSATVTAPISRSSATFAAPISSPPAQYPNVDWSKIRGIKGISGVNFGAVSSYGGGNWR